jgi:hypothetical protein
MLYDMAGVAFAELVYLLLFNTSYVISQYICPPLFCILNLVIASSTFQTLPFYSAVNIVIGVFAQQITFHIANYSIYNTQTILFMV